MLFDSHVRNILWYRPLHKKKKKTNNKKTTTKKTISTDKNDFIKMEHNFALVRQLFL